MGAVPSVGRQTLLVQSSRCIGVLPKHGCVRFVAKKLVRRTSDDPASSASIGPKNGCMREKGKMEEEGGGG